MIRVAIADDHAVVRQGLKQIIQDNGGRIVVEAATGFEALAGIGKQPCDVVVLDVSLPGKSGLDVLRDLKQSQPKLPVLMLSMYPEDQFAVRALRMGASGYITKDSAPEELMAAIRKVISGGKYISPSMAEQLAETLTSDGDGPPHEALSDREYQVLRLIASGKSVSEIAELLALSVKTISTYRTRILEKMRLKNNAELIQYAIRNRLVE
jgi:DNA-binding NarL/FixJ family response regulator